MIINLGDAPFKAFITVTYLADKCTVSLGDKTFTHNGGGKHTFTVNKKGTWTIAAISNKGATETKTVSITYNGQIANISMACALFANGAWQNPSITGGWEASTVRFTYVSGQNSGVAPTVSINNGTAIIRVTQGNGHSGSYSTKNKINLTDYSKLVLTGSMPDNHHVQVTYCGIAFVSQKTEFLQSYAVAKKMFSHLETFNNTTIINVSGITGSYYLTIGIYADQYPLNITNMRLEP